jgi:hypothetical protein
MRPAPRPTHVDVSTRTAPRAWVSSGHDSPSDADPHTFVTAKWPDCCYVTPTTFRPEVTGKCTFA